MEKKFMQYNPEIIKLIDTLVNKSNLGLKFEKIDDGKRVSCNYKSVSYLFHIDFPVEMFEFSGEQVNFYDFCEFANIMNVFKNPNVIETDNSFILDMDKSSVEYYLGDPAEIKSGFNREKEFDSDLTFSMSKESIKKLNSCKNLFSSEYLSFVYDGETLKARLTSKTRGDNKYEEFYAVDEQKDVDIEFKTFALVVGALTIGDWVVDICKDGLVRYSYQNTNGINLNLYSLHVED